MGPIEEFANDPSEVHALFTGYVDGWSLRPIWDRHPDARPDRHYYTLSHVNARLQQIELALLLGAVTL